MPFNNYFIENQCDKIFTFSSKNGQKFRRKPQTGKKAHFLIVLNFGRVK